MVGVTICDFPLWPEPPNPGGEAVPMLSRWRMQVPHVFLELPKYAAGNDPQGNIEHWAYFFRETMNLDVVPPALLQAPYREALEITRLAGFSADELDVYERVKMSEQDARGALSLARRQGFEEGFEEGLRETREERRRQGLDGGMQAFEIKLGDSKAILLEQAGAFKDAESMDELFAQIYKGRGRPEVE